MCVSPELHWFSFLNDVRAKKKSKEGGDGRIGASGGKTFVKVCQVMSAILCQTSPATTSPHLKRSRELGEPFQYWGPFY